ncbi:MAG: hypothetical protein WCF78_01555 [archaeon]
MIEFTLSKLNLLIFVTAIAAIVLFFMNTVSSNLMTRQGFELAYKTGKELKSGIDSESYCTIKYIDIPVKLKTNENTSSIYSIPYVMNISTHKFDLTTKYENKMVITIMNLKKTKILAAYDVDYNGEITFINAFKPEDQPLLQRYYTIPVNWNTNDISIDFSPTRADSIDSTILFIKKVKDNKNYFYIMPCAKKYGYRSCGYYIRENMYPENDLAPGLNLNCIAIEKDLTTEPV